MDEDERVAGDVAVALRTVPGVRTLRRGDDLVLMAGGEVPPVTVDLRTVLVVEPLHSPEGAPAVRFVLVADEALRPLVLVVVGDDVAFRPDVDAGRRRVGGRDAPRIVVADMPPMLGWSEVLRCLAAVEGPFEDLDRALAQVHVAAAGIEGARRVGVDVGAWDRRLDEAIDRVVRS